MAALANLCIALIVVILLSSTESLLRGRILGTARQVQIRRHFSSKEEVPKSLRDVVNVENIKKWFGLGLSVGVASSQGTSPAKAVGNLFEVKSLPCVIQDVSFNVPDSGVETKMFKALFQDTCYPLREGTSEATVAFGPDIYDKPAGFLYGVSPFSDYGAHATLTFKSLSASSADGVTEIVDPGNGLQYVKVGAELLRISKGIQAGAVVEGAYGWIDVQSPGGVPLEVVVGIARDPFMLASLRVQNMKQSLAFFTEEMGMKVMPMPLARQEGSQYEPQQPKDSVFVSYGEDLFGLLLEPSPKGAKINPGGLLSEFTIIADEGAADVPPAVKVALEGNGKVESPDGYTFSILAYSKYKFASKK